MYRTKHVLKGVNKAKQIGRVYVEITFSHQESRERIYLPTDERINSMYWVNGRISKSHPEWKSLWRRLEEYHNEIKQVLFDLENEFGYVNSVLFKNKIGSENEAEKDILTLFDEFVEVKRITAKYKMVRKLGTIRNHLKIFLEGRRMYLVEYNQKFINQLTFYWQEKVRLQPNTIHKNFKFILLFLNHLRKEGIIENDFYHRFQYPRQVETNTILLQKEEVKTLINHNPNCARLSKIKDLFLILIFTGLRFSDGIRISKRWVSNGFLLIHTQKTDEKISIPIHPILKEILEKYDYDLQVLKISNQKFNKSVKELCQEAGITQEVEIIKYVGSKRVYLNIPKYQLIASHTGRRTFITNSILAGIPLSVIQKITGHKKLTTLQKYVDIADGIKAEEMEKLSKYFQ